jgi:glycosyltransferase involved in cell wall biosynthesis
MSFPDGAAPVKIIVDCRYTRLERHDGISRYTARIVTALSRRHPVTMLISDERQLAMLPELPWVLGTDPTSPREPWIARQLNRYEPDVVFSPMQTMGTAGRKYGVVLTLHDLIYYRNRTPPRDLAWPIRLLWRLYHLAWWPQRLLLNRADEIVTVSETTKELMREHRLTDRPITIVANAADVSPADHPPRSLPKTRELLYMGSFMPYKNVETLARAMNALPGFRLHLLSRISDDDRARLAALAPAESIVFHNGVTDREYGELLEGATALLTVSLDEGFGLPIVEAMAVGTPVVLSDIPIFREIAGEAGRYVPATDADAVARAVTSLEDPAEWRARSAASLERARAFDWDRSAAELYEVLERVVKKPRKPRRR